MRRGTLLTLAVLGFLPRPALPQGDPLGPEFRVNTYTTGAQFYGSVAASMSGFVVTWISDHDGSTFGVFGQRYATSGSPLGPEFRINTFTTGIQFAPALAADANGNFVVAWQSYPPGPTTDVFGQRYAVSGAAAGPEFGVNTFTTSEQGFPAVAADAVGNFVVVWDSVYRDGSSTGVSAQRYAASGVPLGAEFGVNTFTTGVQESADVAADPSGNFVVVWAGDGQDGYSFGIFGQRYAASGVPAGSEFRVNTFTTGVQAFPAVAADAAGNFVVVWRSAGQDGPDYGVFGQRYAGSGAPLGAEFRVNTFTTGSQDRPAVAADAAGNFVVTWHSATQDGSSSGIFGQRFDAAGGPLGPEFRINTYTTGAQADSSVASDPSGNFVVVWTSIQDGSMAGVFGQRFNAILPVELIRFEVQ